MEFFGKVLRGYIRVRLRKSIRGFAKKASVSPDTLVRAFRMSQNAMNPSTFEAIALAAGFTNPADLDEILKREGRKIISEFEQMQAEKSRIKGIRSLPPATIKLPEQKPQQTHTQVRTRRVASEMKKPGLKKDEK